MRFGGKPAAIPLALLILVCGLLAGCGGGDEGSGNGSGGSQNGGEKAQGGGGKDAPERKISIGTVKRVKDEGRKLSLRPAGGEQQQDAKPMVFKVRKNAEITLGGQKAEAADIAQDQQAQVEYVVENEVNKAVSVKLFKAGEQGGGGG